MILDRGGFDRLTPEQAKVIARRNPNLAARLKGRAITESRDNEKRRCEDSLIEFFARAWREIDPATLDVNWHHREIAKHLEAMVDGEIRNIVINVPPRASKPVSDDALVLTKSKGLVRLSETRVGDEVLSHRRRWCAVTAVHKQGELDTLLIRTRAGRELRLAPDHPVLTPDGWVEAKFLRPDDVLGIVPGLPAGSDVQFSQEEASLLGYFVGDGSVSTSGIRVTCKDDYVAADIVRCASAIGFVGRENRRPLKTRDVSVVSGLSRAEVNADRFYASMTFASPKPSPKGMGKGGAGLYGPVRRWLDQHGLAGKTSYTKRVPAAVMQGTDEIVKAYLGAYWSCDGFITERGVKRDGVARDDLQIGCDSVSKELMLDTQQLLTRLGINSLVRIKRNKKLITKRQGNGYVSYSLTLRSQDDCWRFATQIKLAHEKDGRIRRARQRRFDFDRDIYGEVVAEVESGGVHSCRCLTVEGDHSFTANGIAVHNSTLASILFPAWVWIQPPERKGPLSGPHVSFLCVSYGATLAEEIALKMRRLVMGEWYQRLWGDRVQLMSDQQSRANFANTAGGERISASVEGGILGRGGDIMILDDVISPGEANSQIERERVLRAISEGLATRVKNPQTAARIMVMQRLHMDDPTNYALDNWKPAPVHLMFPMRFEENRACDADHRSYDGELLWPSVWDAASVAKTELELGDYGYAAQFQQSPIPRSGGIISGDDWKIWPEWTPRIEDMKFVGNSAYVPLPEVTHVVAGLDTALSERETADWTALIIFGVWHRPMRLTQIVGHDDQIDDGEQPRVIMMGAWRMRAKLNDETIDRRTMQPKGVVQRVVATCRRFNVDRLIIEDKTRGLDVKNEIERQIVDQPFQIELFNPKAHGDKVARLHSVQPLFAQGLVYAPANCRLLTDAAGNEYIDVAEFQWVRDVMNEVEQVPRGAHDDLADCCFVAGTFIATKRGDVPIEQVDENDHVLTPLGWCRVLRTGMTGKQPVLTRRGLRGTADHPVFTLERGYGRLDTVTIDQTVSRLTLCSLIRLILRSTWSSTAQPIASWAEDGDTIYRNPPRMPGGSEQRDCMSRFGRPPTAARCRRAMKCITKTTTRLIVILAIWTAYRRANIGGILSASIRQSGQHPLQKRKRQQKHGMRRQTGQNGTDNTRSPASEDRMLRRLIPNPPFWKSVVSGVGRRLSQNGSALFFAGYHALGRAAYIFAPRLGAIGAKCIPITQNRTASPLTLASIVAKTFPSRPVSDQDGIAPPIAATPQQEPVYNLAVEGAECYYANGILVHNCSMSLIKLREDGYLALTQEYVRQQMEMRLHRRRPKAVAESYGV